jgi:membrane-associated phospholipid phosphatase
MPAYQSAGQELWDHDTIVQLPGHVLHDEKAIFLSPLKIRANDFKWLVPLAGATTIAFATDHQVMTSIVTNHANLQHTTVNASNALIGGLVALPAGMYVYGRFGGHEYPRETGMLVAEAGADAVITEQIIKLVTWRDRPTVDNQHGPFFQSGAGFNSSFPSMHSVVAWSTASVLADRYPSIWMKIVVYSLAAGVGVTRIVGQQHFPSDVLIGGASGWLIGHYVTRTHRRHDGH